MYVCKYLYLSSIYHLYIYVCYDILSIISSRLVSLLFIVRQWLKRSDIACPLPPPSLPPPFPFPPPFFPDLLPRLLCLLTCLLPRLPFLFP